MPILSVYLTHTRRKSVAATLFVFGTLVGYGCVAVSADEIPRPTSPTAPRKYKNGPLRVEEFLGTPDFRSPGDAFTASNVQYSFRYQVKQERGRYRASLTSFDAFAVFLKKQSWWRPETASEILDHEQGHFDIAEIAARKLQYAIQKVLNSGKGFEAMDQTPEKAAEKLKKNLESVIQAANQQAELANREYDSMTKHGLRFGSQAEFRRVQKASLQKLAKLLKELKREP